MTKRFPVIINNSGLVEFLSFDEMAARVHFGHVIWIVPENNVPLTPVEGN